MKSTTVIGVCAIVFLAQCATNKQIPNRQISDKHIPDTLIYYEQGERSAQEIKNAYRMVDLVCALPDTWEADFPHRISHLEEFYKKGIPEDFIAVPERGAQVEFTVMRLDKDLVAVTTHSDMDGHYTLRILRRVPCAWEDITDQAFPYPHRVKIRADRDKSVMVYDWKARRDRRYIWNGSQYAEEELSQDHQQLGADANQGNSTAIRPPQHH